jgi:transposase-like protein
LKRSRRNHSAAFKAQVALESLRQDSPIRSYADRYDVHPNLVRAWQAQLLRQAARLFEEPQRGPRRRQFESWQEERGAASERRPLVLEHSG